jgi:hypothetical protein
MAVPSDRWTVATEGWMTRRIACLGLTVATIATLCGATGMPVAAQDQTEVPLAMEKDRFMPAELRVKAGSRFILVITNKDDITHELDIPKLRIEKKVRPGQNLKLQLPALNRGRYELVDDDSTPELHGVMVAE